MAASSGFGGDVVGSIVIRKYKLGGMDDGDDTSEVVDTLSQIDGVKTVRFGKGEPILTLEFDPGKVSEEHLVSTLVALGHGILDFNPE